MLNQSETQIVDRSRETNTPQVDPLFVKSLAENALRNEVVQEELKRQGYTQFNPPYTGFIFDTIPPGLTAEQYQQWQDGQNQKRLKYFANMSDQEKLSIDEQRKAYDASVAYMEAQVSNSLKILESRNW